MRLGINKSKVNDEAWCPTSFFIHYILGIRSGTDMDLYGGINGHLLLYSFYDVVNFKKLSKLKLNEKTISDYIVDTIYDIIPDKYIGKFRKTKGHIIDRFAEIEATRIINLRKRSRFKKLYYFPLIREKVLEMPPDVYGTPDSVWWLHPKYRYNNKKYRLLVVDYKTGKVRPNLMTSNRRELNIYMWLVSHNTGIKMDNIIGMIMQLGDELASCNEGHKDVKHISGDLYYCSKCDKEFYPRRLLYYEYSSRSGAATRKRMKNLRELINSLDGDEIRADLFYPRRYYKKCVNCKANEDCEAIFKYDDDIGIYFDEKIAMELKNESK